MAQKKNSLCKTTILIGFGAIISTSVTEIEYYLCCFSILILILHVVCFYWKNKKQKIKGIA